MNRYILIHRLRWPAVLLLLGVCALLDEYGAINSFWGMFIPLLLIMLGAFMLAERAALAADGGYPPAFGDPAFTGAPNPAAGPAAPSYPAGAVESGPGTSIVPAPAHDLERYNDGGQS